MKTKATYTRPARAIAAPEGSAYDFDIIDANGLRLSFFCGGWVAAQNVVDAWNNPERWEPSEAYEIADTLK